jgi:hypothetical protein
LCGAALVSENSKRGFCAFRRLARAGSRRLFPDDSAYTTAALIGNAAMAITTMTGLALARQGAPETEPEPAVISDLSR